jgi:hypothetical protein
MRGIDGRIRGSGMRLSFTEYEETYRDKKVKRVWFPSDFNREHLEDEVYSKVKYYTMSQEEIERRYGNLTTC